MIFLKKNGNHQYHHHHVQTLSQNEIILEYGLNVVYEYQSNDFKN